MTEFTKEEISLCKQIAKKGVSFEPPDDWHGAYYVFHYDKIFPWADGEDKPYYKAGEFVWLPEISDCLEFLRRKPGLHTLEMIGDYQKLQWHVISNWTDICEEGKTPLEALLKAVLAVLEEAKEG